MGAEIANLLGIVRELERRHGIDLRIVRLANAAVHYLGAANWRAVADRGRPGEAIQRFFPGAACDMGHAEIGQECLVFRCQGDRARAASHGFLKAAQALKGVAEIGMRHGVVRIELEGPAISIDCRFKPVQVLQDIAQIAVCSGKIWLGIGIH